MRRLLGAGRPARASTPRPSGPRSTPACCPAAALAGQEVVTAEGLGYARRAAPGAARDGGARRLAVRLLHAGLRLQHGRRVLPRRPGPLPTSGVFDHARAQRQPVPLHRLPADPRRRLRARHPAGRRPPRGPPHAAAAAGPGRRDARTLRAAGDPRRCARGCSPTSPSAPVVAGCTDSGVEANLRGARPALTGRDRPAPRAARAHARRRLRRHRRRPVASPRSSAGSPARCRCSTQMFPQFASRLIRNGATIGGNLGTASPIGDLAAGAARARRDRRADRRPTASARCR